MLIYLCVVPVLPSLPEETPFDANINIEKSKDITKISSTSETTETTLLNSNENKTDLNV
jgi:hypothetical protein